MTHRIPVEKHDRADCPFAPLALSCAECSHITPTTTTCPHDVPELATPAPPELRAHRERIAQELTLFGAILRHPPLVAPATQFHAVELPDDMFPRGVTLYSTEPTTERGVDLWFLGGRIESVIRDDEDPAVSWIACESEEYGHELTTSPEGSV